MRLLRRVAQWQRIGSTSRRTGFDSQRDDLFLGPWSRWDDDRFAPGKTRFNSEWVQFAPEVLGEERSLGMREVAGAMPVGGSAPGEARSVAGPSCWWAVS